MRKLVSLLLALQLICMAAPVNAKAAEENSSAVGSERSHVFRTRMETMEERKRLRTEDPRKRKKEVIVELDLASEQFDAPLSEEAWLVLRSLRYHAATSLADYKKTQAFLPRTATLAEGSNRQA